MTFTPRTEREAVAEPETAAMSSIRNANRNTFADPNYAEQADTNQSFSQTIVNGAENAMLSLQQTLAQVGGIGLATGECMNTNEWEVMARLTYTGHHIAKARKQAKSGWNRNRNQNGNQNGNQNWSQNQAQANASALNSGNQGNTQQGQYQDQPQGQTSRGFVTSGAH